MTFRETLIANCRAKAKPLGRLLTSMEVVELASEIHETVLEGLKKPRVAPKTSTDNDWITQLEQDPALAGIDVKKQLGMAQFWCRNNNRLCTRKFFVNWLQKAERTITVNADGMSSKVTLKADIYTEPQHWELIAARIYSEDIAKRMKENGWTNISPDMRNNILRNAK